jgi:hypothetical protein
MARLSLLRASGLLRECPPTNPQCPQSPHSFWGTWRTVRQRRGGATEEHLHALPSDRGAGMFSIASLARRRTGAPDGPEDDSTREICVLLTVKEYCGSVARTSAEDQKPPVQKSRGRPAKGTQRLNRLTKEGTSCAHGPRTADPKLKPRRVLAALRLSSQSQLHFAGPESQKTRKTLGGFD